MIKSLHDKAVLVKFVKHHWNGIKVDQVATEKVAVDFETKGQVGKFHKLIVPKEFLQEVNDIRIKAYLYHMTNTLPWMDGGVRLNPVSALQPYLKEMRKFQSEHRAAVKKIIATYDQARKDGMMLQGKLANPADYPTAESLEARFGMEVIVMQLPSTTDWRIEVPKAELDELKQQAERDMQQLQQAAILDLYQRLNAAVEHAQERLSDEKAVFRNSLFDNIKEVVSVVSRLNFASDPKLEEMRKEIEAKLSKQTPDEVRADPGLRKKVAKDAEAIMKKMQAYMKPGGK